MVGVEAGMVISGMPICVVGEERVINVFSSFEYHTGSVSSMLLAERSIHFHLFGSPKQPEQLNKHTSINLFLPFTRLA